jgi:hypothetical protein
MKIGDQGIDRGSRRLDGERAFDAERIGLGERDGQDNGDADLSMKAPFDIAPRTKGRS